MLSIRSLSWLIQYLSASQLANDIQHNPQRLKTITPELVSCIQNLVGDINIDLDAPLDDEGG